MIDRRGKTVINGRGWECIKSAGAGYAAVKSGGKWGYVDMAGRRVTEIVYDKVRRIKDGRGEAIRDGKTVFIEFFER